MFEAVVLGIVQGLTEFIPVSSSAHLILFPWFFGWTGLVDSLSFSVALHFGTLLALLVYFRKDWIGMLGTARNRDGLIWNILAATIPAAAAGFLFRDQIEALRSPLLIILTLSGIAGLMIFVERTRSRDEGAGLEGMNTKKALFIGAAQALALVPGVSRSGITIIAGLSRGLSRTAAARFSFLMGTPIIAGASFLEARELFQTFQGLRYDVLAAGIIVSAVTGFAAIKFLLHFLQKHTLEPFAYYRFFIAFVIIVTVWLQ